MIDEDIYQALVAHHVVEAKPSHIGPKFDAGGAPAGVK